MILVISSDEDVSAVYFCVFLKENKCKFLFANQKFLGSTFILKKDSFIYKENEFYYKDFTGVYLRISSPSFELLKKNSKLNYYIALLISIINCKFKNIVNSTISQATNYSKLYQLAIVKNKLQHIKIPQSLVLANNTIKNLVNNNFIYKSLSAIRSIVTNLNFELKKNVLLQEPVLFQTFLNGHNIRIHVIGNDCFATLMLTKEVDYRYDISSASIEYIIPENLKKDCLYLNKLLELNFSGIDLIKVQNSFYLLEVNPSPGYSSFDRNYEISKKLQKFLYNN